MLKVGAHSGAEVCRRGSCPCPGQSGGNQVGFYIKKVQSSEIGTC